MTITQRASGDRIKTYARQRGVAVDTPELSSGTTAEMKDELTRLGISFPSKATKPVLLALVTKAHSREIDISRLTPRQQRRIRKKGR